MNVTAFLKTMNAVDDIFIKEAACDPLPKPKRIWHIGTAVAACLCVVATAWISVRAWTLITAEDAIGPYLFISYSREPYKGEVWFSMSLQADFEKRGEAVDEAVYWVQLSFSDETNHTVNMDKDLTMAECKRLVAHGYDLYIHQTDWIGYWGEEKHYSTVYGALTKAQMDALSQLSQYGCYIELAKESATEYVAVKP